MIELRLPRPGRLDGVTQVLRLGNHAVYLVTGTIDVLICNLGNSGGSYRNDEKSSKDPGKSAHGAPGGTAISSPSKAIRPSSLSNVRCASTERAANG